MEPREIVPLSSITHVQRIQDKWYLKKDWYYLEYYHTTSYIIGAKNEEIINVWVSYIYQHIIYAHYLED